MKREWKPGDVGVWQFLNADEQVAVRVPQCPVDTWRLLADGEWVCVDGPDRGEYAAWDYLVSSRGPVEVES